MKKKMNECAFPGCGRYIEARSLSGMCMSHQHRPGCRCAPCRARAIRAGKDFTPDVAPVRKVHPDRVTVMVSGDSPCVSSADTTYAPVTLPRPPWLHAGETINWGSSR